MELQWSPRKIEFEKELSELDRLTLEFCSVLNKHRIKYVVVSGYVAILFGRNRASEDIDIIIEKIPLRIFEKIWTELIEELVCLNTTRSISAYNQYLKKDTAIRFSRKGKHIPNIEMKFAKTDVDTITIEDRMKVMVNGKFIFIPPLELQIVFKLFLGSEKDIEDARYLYTLFKDKLNKKTLKEWFRKLNISEEYRKYIQ